MIYIHLFLAFFIPGMIGYGGGAATVPLIQKEVVETYAWMTTAEYSMMLALGNTLPGPIATKIAGYVGYQQAGFLGACVALFATVAPPSLLMFILLSILSRFRESQQVKRLKTFVIPVVAILMLQLTVKFFSTAIIETSWLPVVIIGVFAYITLEKFKWNPAIVICIGLLLGGFFLS
ncbi:hypothetical protein PAESOLCIP111_06399 [Paenibacillus solanacearum]|uniref:Chromate transporter n=1 Tax=Paenibacillus solanacearum TaxID=2048548 RepID=A0A916KA89_9BACL|nr:chromate transporter [Paenibacillus solanacearum]CAG7651830.1 hypothetical protein PAESOLCIP111_06399 [Paenibacillus solanacearum]